MAAEKGNQYAAGKQQPRVFEAVLRRVLLADDAKRLRKIALKLSALAEKGNIQAAREILDRFEGKPRQQIEVTGANGGALEIKDATTSLGIARRVAYVLELGTVAQREAAKNDPMSAVRKEA